MRIKGNRMLDEDFYIRGDGVLPPFALPFLVYHLRTRDAS
jgi:hypothetical protein